jgi:mannose-6-phosphate isomerase-like protein (cupin superfamily)
MGITPPSFQQTFASKSITKKEITMKKIVSIIGVGILLTISANLHAQSWTKVDPKMTKMLTDTTLVRAYIATLAPGEKSTSHTHPAAFFYALTSGKLHVTYSDGKTEDWDLKEGESGYSGPERPHVTQNTGDAPMKFLLVELKEHPYKADKK